MSDSENNTNYLFMVIMLVLTAIAAIAIIITTSLLMKKSKNETTNQNITKTEESIFTHETTIVKTTTKSQLDSQTRINYNNILSTYVTPLLYVYNIKKDGNLLNNIIYNKNILNSKNKYIFSWYMALNDESIAKSNDIDENGNQANGISSILLSDFNLYYQRIFDTTFDINSINFDGSESTSFPKIVNNRIYGSNMENEFIGRNYMDLKTINVENTNDATIVTADILIYTDETGKINSELFNKYTSSDILDYPAELAISTIEFTYRNNKLSKITIRENKTI